jgi:hypothetical protein
MNRDTSSWIGIISAIWLLIFILGRWQFNRIKQFTTDLILDKARQARKLYQKPSIEDFYAQIQPEWQAMLRKNAWFILHASELFPVPAHPLIVQKRLKFTPAWMGAYLRLNGIYLSAETELESEIDRIVSLAPPKKRGKS